MNKNGCSSQSPTTEDNNNMNGYEKLGKIGEGTYGTVCFLITGGGGGSNNGEGVVNLNPRFLC